MAKKKKKKWSPWSEEEVKLLKKLYPKGKAREVAELTGRPLTAVTRKACYMGITREASRWSKKEIGLLKQLYPTKTAQEIADKIGRTVRTVRRKAFKLGLRKT